MEKFDYHRENAYGALGNASLNLDGQEYGYRIGAAYEITDIALRGQVMYRSGTSYGADGLLTAPRGVLFGALRAQGVPDALNPFAGGNPTTPTDIPALGVGELPQSVEFKLQSGIAPGWLAFGSVKWTDWSKLTTLDVRSKPSAAFPNGVTITQDKYFWKDGWTVTGGIGHAFNDQVSGFASLTWDQGVGTGWDIIGDTYTLAVGGSFKDGIGGEFRGGVGFSYLGSGEETQYAPGMNQGVKSGYAFALNGGYSLKW